MAASLAEIILFGLFAAWFFKFLKIPGLLGMLLVGIIMGPYVLNVLDPSLIKIGTDLRLIALIVILLKAGLELSAKTLNKVGLQAILLSVIPALTEGVMVTILGPLLLGLTLLESALLASVLAAVSPAVVVPYMIRLIEERRGTGKGIPTLILAAASLDDVFVIVIYTILIGFYTGEGGSVWLKLGGIPVSIAAGIAAGLIIGFLLYRFFEKHNPRATKRVLIVLGISILLYRIEHYLEGIFPFASLIAVMAVGFIILEKRDSMAHEISAKLGKIWIFAEILLFAMVGTQVNIHVAFQTGLQGVILIFCALAARSLGVFISLIGCRLSFKERLFVVVSYMPKATVQAALGGAPLLAMRAAGLPEGPGEIILAVAVLSIVITAPLGAFAMERLSKRLLTLDPESPTDSLLAAKESGAPEEDLI